MVAVCCRLVGVYGIPVDDIVAVSSTTVASNMSQQLHRRNPSQESMEHLIPSSSAMIPHSSSVYTSTSPEQRKAKHPIHPIPEDHDLEMNATKTAPLSSTIPSKLKSKSSTVSDEKIGSGGVGNALPASAVKAVYSCGMYSFCSVSMILVNKSLASRCVLRHGPKRKK